MRHQAYFLSLVKLLRCFSVLGATEMGCGDVRTNVTSAQLKLLHPWSRSFALQRSNAHRLQWRLLVLLHFSSTNRSLSKTLPQLRPGFQKCAAALTVQHTVGWEATVEKLKLLLQAPVAGLEVI